MLDMDVFVRMMRGAMVIDASRKCSKDKFPRLEVLLSLQKVRMCVETQRTIRDAEGVYTGGKGSSGVECWRV